MFFVVGSPRSGTTLLQSMLTQAPDVTIPPETQFLGITLLREGRLGPIASDAGWRAAVNAVVARNDRAEFPVSGRVLRERLERPGERSHARMLSDWLSLCAEQAGAQIVGEKSPMHTPHAPRLARMFPDARFVHITRDPRDVALSHREVWARPVLQAALRWRVDQARLRRFAATDAGSRITRVRYEDLVTDPEPTIKALATFLGIQYVAAMIDPSGRSARGFAASETHKLQTLEKVTTARIGRYRGKLRPSRVALVQSVCGVEMDRLGYKREPTPRLAGWLAAAAEASSVLTERRASGKRRAAVLDREAGLRQDVGDV
jgi:hypothetical protein